MYFRSMLGQVRRRGQVCAHSLRETQVTQVREPSVIFPPEGLVHPKVGLWSSGCTQRSGTGPWAAPKA